MGTWGGGVGGSPIFLLLSPLVTLAVATILGRVGREVGELLDSAAWSSAPLARGHGEDERVPRGDVARRRGPRVGLPACGGVPLRRSGFLAAACRVGGSRTPSRSRVGAHSDATRWPS